MLHPCLHLNNRAEYAYSVAKMLTRNQRQNVFILTLEINRFSVRNLNSSLSIIELHPSEGKEEQESRTWEDILPRVLSTANLDGREKEGNKDADIGRQSAMHIGS